MLLATTDYTSYTTMSLLQNWISITRFFAIFQDGKYYQIVEKASIFYVGAIILLLWGFNGSLIGTRVENAKKAKVAQKSERTTQHAHRSVASGSLIQLLVTYATPATISHQYFIGELAYSSKPLSIKNYMTFYPKCYSVCKE
ncbi:unnamed protein product, partial [Mesorhabditis spiculigera]